MSSKSSNNNNNKTFKEIITKLPRQVYNDSVDYCIGFAKRRPIMAALIALELGSWTYVATKKFTKSFIWWNTVLELEIKGDYTMVYTNEYS